MQYLDQEAKVVYASKDGKSTKVFDALEWIAAMCSHVPDRGEQMVRYYGYSNVSRGKRQKHQADDFIPSIIESDGISREQRRKWSILIRKIEACPRPDQGKLTPSSVQNVRELCGLSARSLMRESSKPS